MVSVRSNGNFADYGIAPHRYGPRRRRCVVRDHLRTGSDLRAAHRNRGGRGPGQRICVAGPHRIGRVDGRLAFRGSVLQRIQSASRSRPRPLRQTLCAPRTVARSYTERERIMSKLTIALLVTVGLAIGGCAAQAPTKSSNAAPMTKTAYDTALANAEAQFKIDKDACASRTGNAKDICLAEATGKEKVAKADAEAAYKNTPNAREDARIARAEASHSVAKEKCDDLAGNTKDVCVKEADAVLVKAKADAKVDRVAADSRDDAAAKQADARAQAAEEKR